MPGWLLPFPDLTQQQRQMVQLPATSHRLIAGPPGSGKTQIMLHRADHLRGTLRVSPDDFRLVIFTNVLKDYIRSGLADLHLPSDCITTYDQVCREIYETHISKRLPFNKLKKTFDFEEIRAQAQALTANRGVLRNRYAFVLIDEGQDLERPCHEHIRQMARHVTAFADEHQQIYDHGTRLQELAAVYGLSLGGTDLLGAYRNSPEVAALASRFLLDPERRRQYLRMATAVLHTREMPLYFVAPSHDAEMDRLAETIRQRQQLNQRVVVVVAQNRQIHGYAKAMEERGVALEKAASGWKSDRADFSSDVPKICTYHSVKGLTFDVAMLPCLQRRHVRNFQEATIQRLLFIGITRATKWVYLSSHGEDAFGYFEAFRQAERDGQLVLQRGSGETSQGRLFDSDDEESDEGDLLL